MTIKQVLAVGVLALLLMLLTDPPFFYAFDNCFTVPFYVEIVTFLVKGVFIGTFTATTVLLISKTLD